MFRSVKTRQQGRVSFPQWSWRFVPDTINTNSRTLWNCVRSSLPNTTTWRLFGYLPSIALSSAGISHRITFYFTRRQFCQSNSAFISRIIDEWWPHPNMPQWPHPNISQSDHALICPSEPTLICPSDAFLICHCPNYLTGSKSAANWKRINSNDGLLFSKLSNNMC